MRKLFSCLFTGIATILAILFVISAMLALLLFNIEKLFFDPNFYSRALEENQVYERMPSLVGESIIEVGSYNPCTENPLACTIDSASPELQTCLINILGKQEYEAIGTLKRKPTENELQLIQPCLDQFGGSESEPGESGSVTGSGAPQYLKNLTAKDYEAIITLLLPPADMKLLVEEALTQAFLYLDGKNDSAKISLLILKERISGQAGFEVAMQLLRAQPPCTPEQIAQFTEGVVGGESGLVFCNPPQVIIDTLAPEIQARLEQLVLTMPDETVFIKPYTPAEEMRSGPGLGGPFGNDPFTNIHFARMIMRLSFILPASILLLITLLVVRTLTGWLRWWGIPLLITGLLGVILGLAVLPAFNYVFQTYLAQKIPDMVPQKAMSLGLDVCQYLMHDFSTALIQGAIIIALVGLGVILISLFIKTKPGKNESLAVDPTQSG